MRDTVLCTARNKKKESKYKGSPFTSLLCQVGINMFNGISTHLFIYFFTSQYDLMELNHDVDDKS